MDKFDWMLVQCIDVPAWQLKSCFVREGFIWELQNTWMYAVAAAVALLIAGHAMYRFRTGIETGIAHVAASVIRANRRVASYLRAFWNRMAEMTYPASSGSNSRPVDDVVADTIPTLSTVMPPR